MPGLYVLDAGGVSRKYRELHEAQGGVDRKLREMYARDTQGVSRRVFSGAPTWEVSDMVNATPKSNYTLYGDYSNSGSHSKIKYTLKSDDYLIVTGGNIRVYIAEPFPAHANKLLKITWHMFDENGNPQAATSFYMETEVMSMIEYLGLTKAERVKTIVCEFTWTNYGRDGTKMDMHIVTENYGTVLVHPK